MDPNHFQRIEQVFHEALALAAAERARHINEACDGDTDLVSRVHRMIHYAERTSSTSGLLSRGGGLSIDHATSSLVGSTIRQYRIENLLGEGGFGAVYRASQQQPVHRNVALKILKGGMDSRQVIARFEAEREALAMMEHANIARVFDAGQTEPAQGSRPYVVMELVSGLSITEYCDGHRLDVGARLELFITVCQAVQHAHQRGIIHRDLKPSNILVCEIDGIAVPKIIDFGIAKAIVQGQAATQARMTAQVELLGTPQYMSPEQADSNERAIDTRTDIFSLGVLLHELLIGSTPLDGQTLRSTSFGRMRDMIVAQKIERPSARLIRMADSAREVAHRRRTDVSALRRRLRSDLDWIVLKALETDRERRYSSASALADDIRRHVRNEPVLAGPPGAAYRVRKFIRRHRVGVAAAAVVAIAVVAGAIGTTLGMMHAQDSAAQAQEVNQFMQEVFDSVDPVNGTGADVRFAEVLRKASVSASTRFVGHPELEGQIRGVLGKVYLNLSMWPESISEFKQALACWEASVGSDDPRRLQTQVHYAQALLNQARFRETEKALEGVPERIVRALGPDHPMWYETQRLIAGCATFRGEHEQAVAMLQGLIERAHAANLDETTQLLVMHVQLRTLINWMIISKDQQRRDLRTQVEALAREVSQRAAVHFGEGSGVMLEGLTALAQVTSERGDFAGAAEACQIILATSRERLGECHAVRIQAESVLADAMIRLGNPESAAELTLHVYECERPRLDPVSLTAYICDALPYLDRGGRWNEAEQMAREYVSTLQTIGGGHEAMSFSADTYVARFISRLGRLDEAESLFQTLLARQQEAADEPRTQARLLMYYGTHLAARGLYEQAEQQLMTAAELAGIREGTHDAFPDDLIVEFIALYQAWGKPDKVREYEARRQEVLAAAYQPN